MKYNLQFFAEEDVSEEVVDPQPELGEEVSYYEPEPEESEDEPVDEGEVETEKPVQSAEENAKYAAARREAEAQTRRVQAELDRLNARVAEQFRNYTNPITGEKVTDARSYFDALNAQREAQTRQELENAGLNPSILDQAIQNNPVIRQAQEVLARQQAEEMDRTVSSELEQIHALDPSITNPNDLLPPELGGKMENFSEFKARVDMGYSFVDAFKLANFDRLQTKTFDAAKQSAINQAKSTSHLQSTVSASDEGEKDLVEIPKDELAVWKEVYPGLSMKELKKKYNSTL